MINNDFTYDLLYKISRSRIQYPNINNNVILYLYKYTAKFVIKKNIYIDRWYFILFIIKQDLYY